MTPSSSRTEVPPDEGRQAALSVISLRADSSSGRAVIARYLAATGEPHVHSGELCPRGRRLAELTGPRGAAWDGAKGAAALVELENCPDCQPHPGRQFRLRPGESCLTPALPWSLTYAQVGGDEAEAALAAVLARLDFTECEAGDSGEPGSEVDGAVGEAVEAALMALAETRS